ncbi:cell adhesion molecule CEACAM1, partial [Manis javanica]|uniref:cell adhesion molecule CEACAM1 n=1 Tax=Manis javanica TaxID=9974 RepID=UPI003C6DAB43
YERFRSRSSSHRGRDRPGADTLAPPSAPAPRGPVPWQGLLLAVSLLTWNLPTTAQLTVESVPPSAVQGQDVLLLAHNPPESLLGYVWYKGDRVNFNSTIVSYEINKQAITPGIAYSGRETVYPNGSLLFQNVTQEDTGYYTLQALQGSLLSTTATVRLGVYLELSKPYIKSNKSDPVENKDPVVLTCEPQTQNTTYLWSINNQDLMNSSRLELSQDHRTLTVFGVTRNDTGPYECEARNPVSARRSDPLTLNVLYGPDAPTISPSQSDYRTGENLSLSCHAVSNPPAQYSWFINGRPKQSTQELFISNITANDSGSYTCIAHNSGTEVNRTTVKTIKVYDQVTRPYIWVRNTTVTEHEDIVNLTCVTNDSGISIRWFFNNQSLQLTERMKLFQDNRTLTIDPVRREDAGNYHCEVSNTVSVNRSDPIRLDVKYDATQQSSGLSAGAIAGIVIGVLAGVALIAALVYFLYIRKTGGTSDQRDLTEHKPSASNHSQGHSDNLCSKVDEIAYSSLNFRAQEARKETSATLSPKATETVYSEVKRSSATYPPR